MYNSIYLGKRGQYFLFAQSHGGLNFVVERLSMFPSPDKFLPRGSNILNNSDVVLTGTVPTIADSVTNFNGLDCPTIFPTTVEGYVKGTEADGAVYFLASTTTPPIIVLPPVAGELVDGETVGSRNGALIRTHKIGTGFYLCEMKSTNPYAYFPRGKNLLTNSSVTFTKTILASQLAGEDTLFGGLGKPVSAVVFGGFDQKTAPDGAVYFEDRGFLYPSPPSSAVLKLTDHEVVGSRNGQSIKTINLGGAFYLCETKSTSPEAYFVRGKNLLTNSSVSFTKTITAEQLGGTATTFDGLTKPSGITPPTGFVEKTTPDGAIYFERSATANPRDLVSGEVVGTRALSATSIKNLNTKLFGNDFYILEERTNSPESFFVRGKNIVGNSTVTLSKEVDISLLAGDTTTFDGLTLPPSFTTPTGYTKKTETDGAVYFEKDTVVITPSSTPTPVVPPVLPKFTQQTDMPVKEVSFLKKNMMWIIPVAIVGTIAIGIGIYRLLKV